MIIERLGLAMFQMTTEKGLVLMIDPWITGNPALVQRFRDPETLKRIDTVLVSHGHLDHASGVTEIVAANPDVTVVSNYELGAIFLSQGIKNIVRMNLGGTYAWRDIKVTLVPAAHSATYGPDMRPCGPPAGMIITLEDGYKVYYSGDSCLTSEMRFVVGEYFKPDLAILPVGGALTMDPEQAAYAAGEFIKPRRVIPCHYLNPEKAPDPSAVANFLKGVAPVSRSVFGDRGNEFKGIMQKRYPGIETTVLELGECFRK